MRQKIPAQTSKASENPIRQKPVRRSAQAAEPVPHAPVRAKPADAEKITINLGYVDLGQIDLLVSEGFYGNRTDFIRTAIRNQLSTHADAVKQVVARKLLVLGLQHFNAADLQAVKAAGQMLSIRVLGLVTLAQDVTPDLALETIESLDVLGSLHASPAVKAALAQRYR